MSVRKQSCALCSAFNALTNECRRKSPTAIAANNAGQLQIVGVFPGAKAESWCMEFLPVGDGETAQ